MFGDPLAHRHILGLFEQAERFVSAKEETDMYLNWQDSDVRSNYANRVVAQAKDEMTSLHVTGTADNIKQKKADAAFDQVLEEMKAIRIDAGLTPQAIIESASRSMDPRLVEIRNSWPHWTEFMNHITHRAAVHYNQSQRAPVQPYRGGTNQEAQQTQPQPVGQARGNIEV